VSYEHNKLNIKAQERLVGVMNNVAAEYGAAGIDTRTFSAALMQQATACAFHNRKTGFNRFGRENALKLILKKGSG